MLNIFTLLFLAVMAGVIHFYIPPNMDNYGHFHAIACWHYPNSPMHSFREPCNGAMNLWVLGKYEWIRSYPYVGIVYSALYYPLFLLWPKWQSAALFGIAMIIPGLIAAASLLRVRLSIAALTLAGVFPVMFYILRDSGELTLQFSLFYALPLICYHAVKATTIRSWLLLNLAAGFLLAAGIESKPIFLYFVPSIAIVTIAVCWHLRPGVRIIPWLTAQLAPAIGLSASLLILLFSAEDRNYHSMYYKALQSMSPAVSNIGHYWPHLRNLLSTFWLNFPNTGSVIYGYKVMYPNGMYLTGPFWGTFAFALALYAHGVKKLPARSLDTTRLLWALLLASAVGGIMVCISARPWAAHHILQPFYYVLGAFALLLQFSYRYYRRLFVCMITILMASQVACAAFVAQKNSFNDFSWDRVVLLDWAANKGLADHAIIEHPDWGTYYISALYGPDNQLVTFQAPPKRVRDAANKLGRYVAFVKEKDSWRTSKVELELLFPGFRRIYPAPEVNSGWEIWSNIPEEILRKQP